MEKLNALNVYLVCDCFRPDGGCRGFRTGRSKAVTELCNLSVSYVPMISTISAPAPGQERNFANGRYLAAYESGDNEHREGRIKTMRVPSRGIPRDDENSKGAGLAFGL